MSVITVIETIEGLKYVIHISKAKGELLTRYRFKITIKGNPQFIMSALYVDLVDCVIDATIRAKNATNT
jgi:hypothetical protein